MSSQSTSAKDAQYHLYVGAEWTGPYQIEEVQALLRNGEVDNDTFAYEPAQERHLTVEALVAENAKLKSAPASAPGITLNSSIFDDTLILPAQAAQEFPQVIPELRSMYQAYLGLTESRTGDPHELAHQLRKAQQAVSDALAKRQSNTGDLYALVNQIDEVADYLANRHQIPELWQLISEMEKVDLASETAHGIACADAVLSCLVDRAERHEPAVAVNNHLGMLLDVEDQDEHDSVATRKILLSARHEMHNAKQDVNALQDAYSQLEHNHHRDIAEAHRLLAAAEKARAEEHQGSEQAMAELRALAAEIHRLASEADIVGGGDPELLSEVARLGTELVSTDPSTLAYLAEDVLIRMVGRLRQLVHTPEDIAPLREELAKARAELSLAAAIASEHDKLKEQYQEQCRSAERATAQARDREHRLRSMVTALEVTKELHQEVMGDLQGELRGAQTRVETMERELAAVRSEIRGSSTSQDERSQELRDEMQRMVEMRSMLEVRREELAHHLEAAEADLTLAHADSKAVEGNTSALAEKVNQLRQTFDITQKRLKDQQDIAKRLEAEMSSSRNEANELHGRSDDLSRELDDARSSLAGAKKRVEELNVAYGRLENERGALQQELAHRKSTDTIRKSHLEESESGTERFEKISSLLAAANKQAETLEHTLTGERRKVLALAEAQVDAQKRIEDLTAERQTLRSEADTLQSERTADHARHASALSVSIRASIESESHLKQAQDRIATLEARMTEVPVAGGEAATLLQAELAQARDQLAEATQALAAAHSERDSLAEQLRPGAPGGAADPTLSAAVAARDEVHAKLMQTLGERDRLRRDFDRLKNEQDAASVEHRTALKSARDRLVEEQARSSDLEQQLAAERQGQGEAHPEQLRSQLADSLKEQARLRDDLQRHAQQIERLNSGRPSDRDSQLIELARATQQLSAEQERVQALTRSLVEALHAGETARSRSVDFQAKLAAQSAECEQYQLECERLRNELAELRLQGLGSGSDVNALRTAHESRQQTLAELARVTGELAELRGRLAAGEKQELTLDRIGTDQARIRMLEHQLADAKADQLKNENMFSEARSRLVQVSSERDRLAAEIESYKKGPDYSVELRTMRRRLHRARERIRELRAERDQAIQSREAQTGSIHELTGQIERLRATQRAAAEALGLAQPGAGFDSHVTSNLEIPPGVGSTSRLGMALQPLIGAPGDASSSQRGVPRALTRRIVGIEAPGSNGGFTSAFGRPAIPSIPSVEMQNKEAAEQPARQPLQTRVFNSPRPHFQGDPPRQARRPLWPWVLAAGAAAAATGFLFLPPILPCSSYGLVTATLTTIKAPIDGKVTFNDPPLGAQVHPKQHFADIDNDSIDTTILAGLATQKATLEARRSALQDDLARLQQRRLALLAAGAADSYQPLSQLFSWHPLPDAATMAPAPVQGQPDLSHDNLWNAHHWPMTVANPAIGNQLHEVELRIGEMNDQLAQQASGINEVAGKAQDESKRIETNRHAAISAPPFLTFWRRQVADHAWIHSGDAVASFTDPNTVIVEALVSERYLDHMSLGDIAEITLLGDRRTIKGRIQSLLPANQAPENQAGEMPRQLPGRFLLTIAIAPGQQAPTIGQGIKVIVLGQDPGMATNLMAWLYKSFRL